MASFIFGGSKFFGLVLACLVTISSTGNAEVSSFQVQCVAETRSPSPRSPTYAAFGYGSNLRAARVDALQSCKNLNPMFRENCRVEYCWDK